MMVQVFFNKGPGYYSPAGKTIEENARKTGKTGKTGKNKLSSIFKKEIYVITIMFWQILQ